MSFVFRGSRADIEAGGFPGFAPERRAMRIHAGSRPVNSNSLAFLLTVLVLFMVLNSHQMSPNLLLWLVLGVFLMATSLRMYATCQQLAHAAAANNFLGHTELRVHVPPTIALATRGRLQSLRLQLALLDREFDDLDYDTLRALDADNSPHTPSMSEEEINSLPVFKYKVQAQQGNAPAQKSDGPSQLSVSSTGSGNEKKQDGLKSDGTSKTPEDELTCSVCLEQVAVGDLLRSLPCLHQFHVNCIDPWLRQQGTCPICKHQVYVGSRLWVAEWEQRRRGSARCRAAAANAEAAASTNQCSLILKGCSSSMEKVYAVNSPHKKRKSQYELSDPKLVPLKCKFRKRLSCHDDESATTESLGYDCIFMNKTSGTDMVSIPEELDSCENTMSLFGGCIEVDSKNGIQEQSLRKMFEIGTSASSSSSNNFSSEAFNSSHSSGTRETDSWVMHDIENHHSDVMLKPHNDDLERIYNVLEQYDNLMEDKLMADDVFGSAAQIMDEKLYSNGVDDIQILPTGQTGYHSEKKLTIDQEFEQYFSNLML